MDNLNQMTSNEPIKVDELNELKSIFLTKETLTCSVLGSYFNVALFCFDNGFGFPIMNLSGLAGFSFFSVLFMFVTIFFTWSFFSLPYYIGFVLQNTVIHPTVSIKPFWFQGERNFDVFMSVILFFLSALLWLLYFILGAGVNILTGIIVLTIAVLSLLHGSLINKEKKRLTLIHKAKK